MSANRLLVGVISDTHGLLRPQAIEALRGSDLILHAGAAPARVGRRDDATVDVGELRFYLVHNIADLDRDPATSGFAAVIYGHSHKPSIETRDGVLYLNPGSAGPRRFSLPVTVATVRVVGRELTPKIVTLAP